MNEEKQGFWRKNRVTLVILAVCMVAAAIVFQYLPETIPMQWGLNGQVSRYGSRWEVFLIGALPAAVFWRLKRKQGKK